jgi:hypothetical protein
MTLPRVEAALGFILLRYKNRSGFDVKEFKVEIDSLCGNHSLRHSSSLANANVSVAFMVYEGHSH